MNVKLRDRILKFWPHNFDFEQEFLARKYQGLCPATLFLWAFDWRTGEVVVSGSQFQKDPSYLELVPYRQCWRCKRGVGVQFTIKAKLKKNNGHDIEVLQEHSNGSTNYSRKFKYSIIKQEESLSIALPDLQTFPLLPQ